MSGGQRARRPCRDSAAHRAVPKLDGGPWSGRVDDRSTPVNGVRLLSIRTHRRANSIESCAVRAPPPGSPVERQGAGPLRARRVPVHGRAVRPRARGSGGPARTQRSARSEACATNVEDLGFERHEGPILRRRDGQRLDRRTAHRWVRSIGKRAGLGAVHPHMLRAAFIMAALDAGVPLRDVQIAARHADPRTTTIYDRRRQNFDRHAAYVVVAFVAGG